MFNQKVP